VVGALRQHEESTAWKTQDSFERDLIHLSWTLAQEWGGVPGLRTLNCLNEDLAQQNHKLTCQLEAVCRTNDHVMARYNEISEALECKHLDVFFFFFKNPHL
jgi:hypothetical protein